MEAVGYDLYCKMLNEAVKQLKGGTEEEIYTTVMDLNVDAYIPEFLYSERISEAGYLQADRGNEDEEEMDDMLEELIDRFGGCTKKGTAASSDRRS